MFAPGPRMAHKSNWTQPYEGLYIDLPRVPFERETLPLRVVHVTC